jgi:hypothetical protein
MIKRQSEMASARAMPFDSNQVHTGNTSIAKIMENDRRMRRSCSKYKPKTTSDMLINTAAKRTGYAVSLGMF